LGCALEELPAEAPPQGAAARMRALREEIASFGLVNARADEDHRTLSERLIFLQTQADDLRTGVSRLRSIIAEANATVRDRFGATVDELHQHFATFFERLFGGGTCRLIATYDARDLPSGMMVEAQPPGKRTRDMALLSGGERALVALALLFAMLKVRPVPFCLLDEVEAALDESNTGRFGAILRELSAGTQFIVITHNRGTMLHADYLYGVTMSETGISAVVSIALARDEQGQIGLEQARS
jgi:chromosome segregation protein